MTVAQEITLSLGPLAKAYRKKSSGSDNNDNEDNSAKKKDDAKGVVKSSADAASESPAAAVFNVDTKSGMIISGGSDGKMAPPGT